MPCSIRESASPKSDEICMKAPDTTTRSGPLSRMTSNAWSGTGSWRNDPGLLLFFSIFVSCIPNHGAFTCVFLLLALKSFCSACLSTLPTEELIVTTTTITTITTTRYVCENGWIFHVDGLGRNLCYKVCEFSMHYCSFSTVQPVLVGSWKAVTGFQ